MNGKFLPENETVEFEDRLYLNPNTSLQEQTDFISNLRNIQNANNAEINAQTYNLGTAVPSNLGGLVGGEGYFTSRYQTPQNVSVAANLMAANRAIALTEAMQNNLAAQKQRLSNAQKAAYRRAASYGGGGATGGNNGNTSGWGGEFDLEATDVEGGGSEGGDGDTPPNLLDSVVEETNPLVRRMPRVYQDLYRKINGGYTTGWQ